QHDRVHAVLAAAPDLSKQLDLVKAIVAVGVARTVETVCAPLIDHDVKAVKGAQEPVRAGHVDAECLGRYRRALVRLRQRHPVELALLIGGNQPALGIDTERYPRTLGLSGNSINHVDLEACGNPDITAG